MQTIPALAVHFSGFIFRNTGMFFPEKANRLSMLLAV